MTRGRRDRRCGSRRTQVTPSYFRVLRASPMMGRLFTEDDAVYQKNQFAILSYGLWKDMFGRDPGVVGKTCASAA